MIKPFPDDEALDSAAASFMSKVRWMMAISGATTLIAIAAVLIVIGYRIFNSEGSAPEPAEITAMLPQGAAVVAITATDGRVVVTVDVAGTLEARTFDVKTLRPVGRLKFALEP
jgi:multidrug efflux pump subunit AcrA (membrane-fusion protein)